VPGSFVGGGEPNCNARAARDVDGRSQGNPAPRLVRR